MKESGNHHGWRASSSAAHCLPRLSSSSPLVTQALFQLSALVSVLGPQRGDDKVLGLIGSNCCYRGLQ
jgi:hypothetical protein